MGFWLYDVNQFTVKCLVWVSPKWAFGYMMLHQFTVKCAFYYRSKAGMSALTASHAKLSPLTAAARIYNRQKPILSLMISMYIIAIHVGNVVMPVYP